MTQLAINTVVYWLLHGVAIFGVFSFPYAIKFWIDDGDELLPYIAGWLIGASTAVAIVVIFKMTNAGLV